MAKRHISRKFFNVPLYNDEKAVYIASGNFLDTYGVGKVKKGGKIIIHYVIKKPRVSFGPRADNEFLKMEHKNWERLATKIPVPEHLGTVSHPTGPVELFDYAGTDLNRKYDFSKGFNENKFINEHSQALRHIITAWRDLGVVLDPKPSNFTDGIVLHKESKEMVHYIDAGLSEMPGSMGEEVNERHLGDALSDYLSEVFLHEYGQRGESRLTGRLELEAKRLVKGMVGRKGGKALRVMSARLKEYKRELKR